MTNLPGTSTMRLLPFHRAIGNCQLWQRSLAKTLRTHCAGLAARSSILATYRSVQYRLMRRMSVAMQRRRATINILEKKAVDATSTKNAGHARLPAATQHHPQTVPNQPLILPAPKMLTNLQAQRSFATITSQQDTAKGQGERLKQRLLVPVLEFTDPPVNKAKHVEVVIHSGKSAVNRSPNSHKKRHTDPILRALEAKANLSRTSASIDETDQSEQTAINCPLESLNRVGRKKSFAMAKIRPSPMRIRYEMEPSAKHKFSAKVESSELKRSSTLQFLMSKYPLMHKLRSPSLPYIKPAHVVEQGLDTFETRLRALRTAQPLKLRVPSMADSDNLNVTQLYRRNRQSRYAKMHEDPALPYLSKKFGSMHNFKPTRMALPSAKAQKIPMSPRKISDTQSMQHSQDKKATKPKQEQPSNHVISKKHPERNDLSHLLGDLLDTQQKDQTVNIEFSKTAPLFKLVSTSMEGRSNLHRKSFNKQLESPQLFKHSTIKNISQSTNAKRRGAFLGQSAAFRAKTLLENKLSHLLKVGQQGEDEDDDDDDDDHDDEIHHYYEH